MTVDRAHLVSTALRVLAEHHGVAHIQRFLEAGLSRNDVAHLRHLGIITRPRIGWYADARLPQPGVRAVRVGGVLGCCPAAASYGIVVPEQSDRRLEVSIEPGTTRMRRADDATKRAWADSEPGVRWHWEQRSRPTLGWRAHPVDVVLQMAACVERRWLIAAIDSGRCAAQHEPILSEADVAEVRRRLPDHLRSAVDRSDPRSETSGETFVRLGCEDAGIPFEPGRWMTEGYRPDGLVAGWLPIEIDGMATHGTPEAVEKDHEKDATLAQFGMHPLRFTQNKAVRETAWVVDVIRTVWLRGPAVHGSAVPARHAGR